MKFLIFLASLACLSSCDSKGNYLPALPTGGTSNGTNNYAACAQPPAGSVEQGTLCPTTSGKWSNYEVIYDTNGNVTSNKVYCNATDQDVPASQAAYDAIFAGSTSANDFKVSSTCASGLHLTAMAEIVQNIWQKK